LGILELLLERRKIKVPKNIPGIENKYLLKKAINYAFNAMNIKPSKIVIKEDKKYYFIQVAF